MHIDKALSPIARSRRRKLLLGIVQNWQLYLFVLPAMTYYIVLQYWPMYGITIAFKDFMPSRGILGSPWVGFVHFQRFFRSYYFETVIFNTLRISLMDLAMGFPLPVILALMLNEMGNQRYKKIVQTATYAPHFISVVVIVGMIILFLSPTSGIVNHILRFFGGQPVFFMQSAGMFPWIYVLTNIWQQMGWSSVIYFAALASVDHALVEAAIIDGANRFQRMIHISLPVIVPTIVILLILRSGSILSVGYEKVLLMQNDTNLRTSEVISTYVYKAGLISMDYSFSTAVDMFNSVINCTLLILVNVVSKKLGQSGLW